MKESQQVEWKSSWRDDYLRWICGFANAEGGRLVIGRDDRGMAVGRGTTPITSQKTAQETIQEIIQTAQETTQERVLASLRAQPTITRRELASRLGLSDSGIKYHLHKLKAAKRIRHIGATKLGYWEVLK